MAFVGLYRWLLATLPRRRVGHLADVALPDWPGLVGLLLPRGPRTIWNLLVLAFVTLLLGAPHYLPIRLVAIGDEARGYLWYALTLPWWLAVMALPAAALASHRLAQSHSTPGSTGFMSG
jgi:hypothetical protein